MMLSTGLIGDARLGRGGICRYPVGKASRRHWGLFHPTPYGGRVPNDLAKCRIGGKRPAPRITPTRIN